MITDFWPLFGVRLLTPQLELRVPNLDDLAALAALAAAGVHDPSTQPFLTSWTDVPPERAARSTLQWQWKMWGDWSPDDWTFQLVAVADGTVIGTQAVSGQQFRLRREVSTGSWLGRAHQGQGYGTEMRAAVLDLAFEGLGAAYATSEAFEDNVASYGVSRKLGYVDDGIERHVVRGKPVVGRRLRVDRAGWAAARRVPVDVAGLAPCLPMFGVEP